MSGKPAVTYTVEMSRTAHKLFKKLDPPIKKRIEDESKEIAKSPYAAPQLSGLPLPVRSYHFSIAGVQWRIAYTVDDVKAQVIVVLFGVRENFYDKLKRML